MAKEKNNVKTDVSANSELQTTKRGRPRKDGAPNVAGGAPRTPKNPDAAPRVRRQVRIAEMDTSAPGDPADRMLAVQLSPSESTPDKDIRVSVPMGVVSVRIPGEWAERARATENSDADVHGMIAEWLGQALSRALPELAGTLNVSLPELTVEARERAGRSANPETRLFRYGLNGAGKRIFPHLSVIKGWLADTMSEESAARTLNRLQHSADEQVLKATISGLMASAKLDIADGYLTVPADPAGWTENLTMPAKPAAKLVKAAELIAA